MYALAAGAAGVTALALASSAEAKIVYTPAHAKVIYPGIPLDLNHDGTVDFYLYEGNDHSTARTLLTACQYLVHLGSGIYCSNSGRGANGIRKITSGGLSWAAALKSGASIRSREQFLKSKAAMASVLDVNHTSTSHWFGPWANGGKGVKDRYLGFKFKIKGQFHFGWARLNVQAAKGGYLHATLTGYAYETVPGKSIIAGKTKGQDVITLPMDTGTLGHLALGRK
jgi:hypothetical protein